MNYIDLLILICSCFQPIIIGYLVFIGMGLQFSIFSFFFKNTAINFKNSSTRLYECSTNYRLAHLVLFELNALGVVLAYLVYDVDFIFFLSEIPLFNYYSNLSWLLYLYLFALFLLGLCVDFQLFGIKWKY